MSSLPRPVVPPGPHRDLVDELHDLHHRAGWPSLRTLAHEIGVSHTTVSKALSAPALPPWGTVELLVEVLGGDVAHAHQLWLAASTPTATAEARMAGRRDELVVVRRHLEGGIGLLLVSGEAGIGKTTLVSAAAEHVEPFVARAAGLAPLRREPFYVVTLLLRRILESDGGQWFKDALADCPPYVERVLVRILPEIQAEPDGDAPFALARLHGALRAVTATLTALRPLAVLVEDLHWVDPSSLTYLEEQVTTATSLPVVATVRSEEELERVVSDQLVRMHRAATREVTIGPLTLEGTRDQLVLATGETPTAEQVRRIHRLTLGVPLLTDQLAKVGHRDRLPSGVEDHFRTRVDGLDPDEQRVVDVLAVADRGLALPDLARVTGRSREQVADAIDSLVRQHLLAPTTQSEVTLVHPLLAETVRRHLGPGRATLVHLRLAEVLAASATPAPAEVAGHAEAGAVPELELTWRVRAATAAEKVLAHPEAVEHWRRVLDLWPVVGDAPAVAGIDHPRALLGAMRSLFLVGRVADADGLARELVALAPALDRVRRAEARRRAGQVLNHTDSAAADQLAVDALADFEALGDVAGVVGALGDRSCALRALGHTDAAHQLTRRAVQASRGLSASHVTRDALIELAWHEVVAGRDERGAALAEEAAAMTVPDAPFSDVWLATYHSDLQLIRCAPPEAVLEAARPGLDALAGRTPFDSARAGLRHWVLSDALVANVAESLLEAGRVHDAWVAIEPESRDRVSRVHRFAHVLRAWVEIADGRGSDAAPRIAELRRLEWSVAEHHLALARLVAEHDLWSGRPGDGLALLLEVLGDRLVGTSSPTDAFGLMSLARAAADSGDADVLDEVVRIRRALDLEPGGPLPKARHAALGPAGLVVSAELARAEGRDSSEEWARAAGAWSGLGRPHHAAYARWRAGQCALRDARATVAARLLARAAVDAREHLPLTAAIAAAGR